MTGLCVLGSGVHGTEIAAVARRRGFTVELYDDHIPGVLPVADAVGPWVAGAVWPAVRRMIASRARNGPPWDDGRWTFDGAVLSPTVAVGPHTHIGAGSILSHGCQLDEYVTLAAGVVLSGEVSVGHDAFIGAGAVVIHGGITIGYDAFVGAGSVVVDDVAPGVVVAGNPARVVADAWIYDEMANGRRNRIGA